MNYYLLGKLSHFASYVLVPATVCSEPFFVPKDLTFEAPFLCHNHHWKWFSSY